MGQSIVVTEKPSSNPGVVRFETNRALTGMGHERYYAGQDIWGERPPDELARRLLARGGVASVQVNANMITVDLEKGHSADGILELIENLYRFYPDGTPAAGDGGTEAEGAANGSTTDVTAEPAVPEAADAPEAAADPADATAVTADAAPDPQHDAPGVAAERAEIPADPSVVLPPEPAGAVATAEVTGPGDAAGAAETTRSVEGDDAGAVRDTEA